MEKLPVYGLRLHSIYSEANIYSSWYCIPIDTVHMKMDHCFTLFLQLLISKPNINHPISLITVLHD